MKHKVNLEWYCMEWEITGDKPIAINIMYVIDPEEIIKRIKYKGPKKYRSIKNFQELRDFLQKTFMYHFWSKCEHEIIINSWLRKDISVETKIDVYTQIEPNLNRITEYVIDAMQINFKKEPSKIERKFGLEKR